LQENLRKTPKTSEKHRKTPIFIGNFDEFKPVERAKDRQVTLSPTSQFALIFPDFYKIKPGQELREH